MSEIGFKEEMSIGELYDKDDDQKDLLFLNKRL